MSALKLGQATFNALRGCFIEIDGWPANIQTKLALLADGVCNINPENIEDAAKAEELMDSPCGDGTMFACSDIRLLELAAHYFEWSNDEANAPWADTQVDPLPVDQAMALFGQRLARIVLGEIGSVADEGVGV